MLNKSMTAKGGREEHVVPVVDLFNRKRCDFVLSKTAKSGERTNFARHRLIFKSNAVPLLF